MSRAAGESGRLLAAFFPIENDRPAVFPGRSRWPNRILEPDLEQPPPLSPLDSLTRLRVLVNEMDAAAGRPERQADGQVPPPTGTPTDSRHILRPIKRALQTLEKQLEEQEKERQQLRALQEVGAALNSSLDPTDVLNAVMDTLIQLTGAERGFLMLMSEETGEIEVQAARNINRETISDPQEISSTVIMSVLDSGQPLLTTNARSDPRFSGQESIINYNLRSILCVPLNLKKITIGVIYADNRIVDGIFREQDTTLLTAFANQAAVAIENARLFRQIRLQLAEITEIKTLMDDVLASIPSGVITIDNADRITLYTQAAGRILGIPGSRVEARPYEEIFAEVADILRQEITRLMAEVVQNGRSQSREMDLNLPRRPGTTTLNFNLSPLRDVQQKSRGVAMVLNDVTEKKRLESVRRYLPPALVDQVRDFDAAHRPQQRVITVLFADITGFSAISEQLAPEELVDVINDYFSIAALAINNHEGIIDKFMGDAVMALFNTQLNPQEDHGRRAVCAALEMQAALAEFQKNLSPRRCLYFGFGIHTGEAVVGNVGSSFRKDFTALGDAVNLAKRIEENASENEIVISQSLYDAVRDFVVVEPREPMRVRGRQALEQTYLLLTER